MKLHTLVFRYSFFALLATLANLLTQRLVLHFGTTTPAFVLAMGAGTLVGLMLKFVLDKLWIFGDVERDLKANAKKFSIYTAAGVVTTLIFWGMETTFWLVGHTDVAREVGAVLGLAIGYVVKYNLDKRFVFKAPSLQEAS